MAKQNILRRAFRQGVVAAAGKPLVGPKPQNPYRQPHYRQAFDEGVKAGREGLRSERRTA